MQSIIKVRLQDVIDLLAKAGIGKESYSVINQGMSDAVTKCSTPLKGGRFLRMLPA